MDRDAAEVIRWRVRSAHPWQEVPAAADYRLDNRGRPGAAVLFQFSRQGTLCVHSAGRIWRVPPGHAALMRFGDATSYGHDPASAYVGSYITFQGAGLQEHWQELIGLYGIAAQWGEDTLARLLALIQSSHQGSAAQIAGQVHAFVMHLYDGPGQAALPACDRAIAAIRSDPCAIRSLKRVAAEHGITREHLARAFRARVGAPAWSFITRARLARARSLLADPALTVAEVARLCGYASARVLARNLAEADGRAPGSWRR